MTDLERLAAAMRAHDLARIGLGKGDWNHLCGATQQQWLDAARAVLTALREPSNAVLDAGADNLVGSVDDDWRGDALIIWRAMIDTILSETEPSPGQ
ncbi:MAG: hypothetical protein ACKVOB_13400 [Sphingomonas sp.]